MAPNQSSNKSREILASSAYISKDMTDGGTDTRDIVFVSKATPGDDAFVLWLAPKLEAAGYKVFADIKDLDTGDEWRGKITSTLQNNAIKMLLCCSDKSLARRGVKEEIGIAEDLVKELGDPAFIMPLRLEPFKKLFGIGELQYQDFSKSWADGLSKLLISLDKQNVIKAGDGTIQPLWAAYQRRRANQIRHEPEVLTSNWIRIITVPDKLYHLEPKNPFDEKRLMQLGERFQYPLAPFERGFLTFASPFDLEEHFASIGPFEVKGETWFASFVEEGDEAFGVEPWDASNMSKNLIRQAWEKHCAAAGFGAYEFANGTGYHATDAQIGIGKKVPWGVQGKRRYSMLRNIARKRVWEYGVSAIPSTFPFPHLRLKGRVIFSEVDGVKKGDLIEDPKAQHRLRRSICSGWRNKAWHGRIMAFIELLAGESPYIDMPVGGGASIVADGMPVQVTCPVTALQTHRMSEEAEEQDETTLGGYFDEEDS